MDRSPARLCSLPLGFLLASLATGCSLVPTIAYIIKPEDVAAEFDELNGKRVVVICRAASLEYCAPDCRTRLVGSSGRVVAKERQEGGSR